MRLIQEAKSARVSLAVDPMTVFSTAGIPVGERLPLWGEAVWRMIGGLDSQAFGDEAFEGKISGAGASYVHVCKLEATRHIVVRTPEHARRADIEVLKVVAQLKGTAQFEQLGRSVRLYPGDWSVYDTSHSYTVINPTNVEQLILMIPKARLPERLNLENLLVRRLTNQQGVSRLAWMSMVTAFEELPFMAEAAAEGTADVLARLVFLSLLNLRGESTAVGQRAMLRDRIKAHVARRLRDPTLSVKTIALALNCSRRHLYNAFADEGDGVAEYILVERLAAARADLADPRQQQRSVTDIAFETGFNQPAHFSKVFAACYGCSPREWRRRACAGHGLTAQRVAQ